MNKETEKEFDKICPGIQINNWEVANPPSSIMFTHAKPEEIKSFISTHFIDRRTLEEELKYLQEENGQRWSNEEEKLIAEGWVVGRTKTIQELREKLLTNKKV